MTKKHDEALNTVAVTQESVEKEVTADEEVVQTVETDVPNDQNRDLITHLEEELEQAKQIKDDYYNRMLRIQADLENFRRRSRQEMEQLSLCAGEDLVKKILPVLDSLERAISSFKDNNESKSWMEGVDLTLKQFQSILKSEGLEVIPALNELFDPQSHEAVCQEPQEQVTEPTVIEELQKGYRYKGKLLRPSLVKVAVPQG
jgi:molecular chaperone GrpE